MSFKKSSFTKLHLVIAFCGLAYLAVLPMARTIGLRNLLLAVLLLAALWTFVPLLAATSRQKLRETWPQLPWPVLLWVGYLLVFPVFSSDPAVAWDNLLGQWGKGIMALAAGATMAWWFSQRPWGSPLALGLAAFVPIAVYLALFTAKAIQTGTLPWAYRGIEEHHSYLGYAVAQTVLLLAAAFLVTPGKGKAWIAALVLLALLSMALIQSRAGLAFGLLAALIVAAVSLRAANARLRWQIGLAVLLMTALGGVSFAVAVKTDARWQNIGTRLAAGWMGDAIDIECEGTASVEPAIRARYGASPQTEHIIAHIRDGDGARVVLLRAATELALQHPWGLDGSRAAFWKRLREICPTPAYSMAHAHNAWLDTALAIGWPGAFLFLAMLVYFMKLGWRQLKPQAPVNPWALVLVATPLFWLLRGVVDSCYRDHMLEMQGFLMAYAAVSLMRSDASPEGVSPIRLKA